METKYGAQNTFYFSLYDPTNPEDLAVGVPLAAGDARISKDGAAFGNTTNTIVDEGEGNYSLVLTATELQTKKATVLLVDQTATKVWMDTDLQIETYGDSSAEHLVDRGSEAFRQAQTTIVTGTLDNATFTPTATQFEADDITEATAGHFNGRIIIWTSGALQYQAASITNYSLQNSKGFFTVSAMTEAPANNDTFVIL